MTFIATYTTRRVDATELYPSDISLDDIAHSLSLICRFAGHIRVPYSVAQHSLWVAGKVRELGGSIEEQRAALMHDASEAYLGDLASPYKSILKDYLALEFTFQSACYTAFGIKQEHESDLVTYADTLAGLVEARDLHPFNFDNLEWTEDWKHAVAQEREIVPVQWEMCERYFLSHASHLGLKHVSK